MKLITAITLVIASAAELAFGTPTPHFFNESIQLANPNGVRTPTPHFFNESMQFAKPNTPRPRTIIGVEDGADSGCVVRPYKANDCMGEELDGWVFSSLTGCHICREIEGDMGSWSLQGDCPDGNMYLYEGAGCTNISDEVPFINSGSTEACYEAYGAFVSLKPCFGVN